MNPDDKDIRDKLDKRVTTQGVYDPPEPDEVLPDGLRRNRMGPLNKDTGRRATTPQENLQADGVVGTAKRNGR
jgi:hypothetical protein